MAPLDLMSAGSVQSIVKEVAYGEARADVRRMSTVTPQSSLNVTSMMSNTSGTAAATPQTKHTSQTSGSSTRRGGGGRARGRGRGRGVDAQGSTLSATQSLNRSGLDTTSMDSTMGGSLASQRQLGPTRPAIDPYGMYHLPHERDSGRLAYGSRPAGAEPHVVLEYRELVPALNRHAVRQLMNGTYMAEAAKSEEQKVSEEAVRNADLTAAEVVELRDEAAAADAATLAALTYLDATDGSDALLKKLEAQRVGPQKHTGMSYGLDAICQYPPDSDSDNDSMADVELSMANTHLDYKVHRHRCQIPMDYLDLQRNFVAQHPDQYRPLSIEREDGEVIQPHEKRFYDGETIVFREFTMTKANVPTIPKRVEAFDWERAYAEHARDDPPLRDRNAPPALPPGHRRGDHYLGTRAEDRSFAKGSRAGKD